MEQHIKNSITALRAYFASGATKSVDFRLEKLRQIKEYIRDNRGEILAAIKSDLGRSEQEAYLTEISIVTTEIDMHLKSLKRWARPQRVPTPIHLFPSKSSIIYEPLGVALIVAPWNYPFNLLITPLIGAISAGCCAMLKPSDAAAATTAVMVKMIRALFEPSYIDIVEGGREVNTILFKQRYDIIFFTGSPQLGKVVCAAAAKHLTPVVMELGGKSPCIVDEDANIVVAARRIVWGKCLNSGQTCIAPDYLYVHSSVKKKLLAAAKREIKAMYGEDVKQSSHFSRMINDAAFDRVVKLMDGEDIYYGGECDRTQKYISPTIIDGVTPDSKIMQEEIFGPLLPVMTFNALDEVYSYINSQEKPLALYYFGRSGDGVLQNTTSGGMCINDTIIHISNHNLPFGGVGNSGFGRYHGKESYTTFSNCRAVVTTPTWIDMPFRYAPFKFFKFVAYMLDNHRF